MPPPRAFSHELLRSLLVEHPTWSNAELATALTEDNARRGLPAAKVDSVRTIASRLTNEMGLPPRGVRRYTEVAPPEGTLATKHKMATPMRYLRDLAAMAGGDVPQTHSDKELRHTSQAWLENMRAKRTVVDLTADGEPIIREARPEELNGRRELISVMAWRVPGWRNVDAL